MKEKVYEIIGAILYKLKFKPYFSTDIAGRYTAGYGKLDHYGYFKFPAWKAAVEAEKQWEAQNQRNQRTIK